MNKTENYKLNMPERTDFYSIEDFNENANIIDNALSEKVDKQEGKELSTNDYTTAEKTKLSNLNNYDDSEVRQLIGNKVDKVSGKGLSTNDFTTEEKNKLSSLNLLTTTTARWTPTINTSGVAFTLLSNAGCRYTKYGNIVTINLAVQFSLGATTPETAIKITNLPFRDIAFGNGQVGYGLTQHKTTFALNNIVPRLILSTNENAIYLTYEDSNRATQQVKWSDLTNGLNWFYGNYTIMTS